LPDWHERHFFLPIAARIKRGTRIAVVTTVTIVAWIVLAFGALNILGNLGLLVRCLATGKGGSLIPLLGGVFAFAGCALLPMIGWRLGLLAFAIDPGCAWLAVCAIVAVTRSLFQ
jgi:hypothetical protein